MSLFVHRRARRWLSLHFQKLLSACQEEKLWAHLQSCRSCQTLYEVYLVTEGKGPNAAKARRERLAQAIFGKSLDRPKIHGDLNILQDIFSKPLWVGGLASVIIVFFLAMPLASYFHSRPGQFREKASPAPRLSQYVSMMVIRRVEKNHYKPAKQSIRQDEPLIFLYSNQSALPLKYIFIFGLDELYNVYWFYPAWVDAKQNPSAYPIKQGKNIQLPDEVIHHYQGHKLRLFALFMPDGKLTVQDIEKHISRLKEQALALEMLPVFPLPNVGQHTLLFQLND